MANCIIKIENVSFSYNGSMALKDINLEVYENDFLALLGPNGGGKTTLLKLISGLLKPDKGRIELFGKPPEKNMNKIGYVSQETDTNKTFPISVWDVVMTGRLAPYKTDKNYKKMDKYAVKDTLELMQIWECRKKRIGEISGGQRKRVLIARALAGSPEILLLDEPTAGIDAYGQAAIYELFKELNKKITIIIATHDFMTLSNNIKTAACVNKDLHFHNLDEVSSALFKDTFSCSIELMQKIGA
jgi:zinc transport system ATP-binding protein